jgi:hypothetical protein
MKYLIIIIIFFASMTSINAQNLDYLNQEKFKVYTDLNYGTFERNKFDLILPTEQSPHGLVIYIHGGGFKIGDKKFLYKRKADIEHFIESNIAVATINYRFYTNNDSLGVKICLTDVKKALQYIRHNAKKYNIDKERIGCYGISAGAGSSLYLAFHDEMAIKGDTTLLGESTRIKCAGAIATQSTYDVFIWKKVIPLLKLFIPLKKKMFYNAAANFYGYEDYKSLKNQKNEIRESLDMLGMIDTQDPPVYLMNLLPESFPKNNFIIQHHKKHAMVVSKTMNKHNIENHLYTSKNAEKEEDIDFSIRTFLVQHLK